MITHLSEALFPSYCAAGLRAHHFRQ